MKLDSGCYGTDIVAGNWNRGKVGKTTHYYTGHEKDQNAAGTADDLDYMHARYSSANLGRFLTADPQLGAPERLVIVPIQKQWPADPGTETRAPTPSTTAKGTDTRVPSLWPAGQRPESWVTTSLSADKGTALRRRV